MLAKICSDRNKPNGQFFLANERDAIMVRRIVIFLLLKFTLL